MSTTRSGMRTGGPKNTRRTGNVRRNRRGCLFLVFVFLAAALLCGAGYTGYLYMKYDKNVGRIAAPDAKSAGKTTSAKDEPKTILLLGMDSRPQTGTLNTDVIMVAALNPKTGTAAVVSIPRDTRMKPENYRARKANAFYAKFRSEDKATAESKIKSMFGDYLGVKIDYLVRVQFTTLSDVVDALGGVKVNVDMDMCYKDSADGTNIQLHKGKQTLDGDKALDFVRYRKSSCGGTKPSNDYQRNLRQHLVIASILDKTSSFTGVFKIGSILDAIGSNVHSDIPKGQLKSLIWTYKRMSNDKIKYVPLNGTWSSPFIYVSDDKLEAARAALKSELGK